MLPQARRRIAELVGEGDEVLQVGAGAAPLARADWVLDDGAYEARGDAGTLERFTRRTWLVRDVCAREPWPFADGRFALGVCTSLVALRDPVGVCAELARVARAGYVEVPTVEAELAFGVEGPWLGRSAHRWLCDVVEGELVFAHKPHAVHSDLRARVPERWRERMREEDLVHGLFWQGALPARERSVDSDEQLAELAARVRRHFDPSAAEVALTEARGVAQRLSSLAVGPARAVVDRGLSLLGGRPGR